ncbi:hypothetical protein E2C01_028500 [Portunus trituberculatus]|uniref:Uncharacterized protein n=1 Tax=Portunus trituberculatus TaxID=210409 RepID=A0A5B7EP88_PORTR|nr:hypothetical protein [Portunus trituberculatus]
MQKTKSSVSGIQEPPPAIPLPRVLTSSLRRGGRPFVLFHGSPRHLASPPPRNNVVRTDPGEIRRGSEIFVPHTSLHRIFSTG